MLNACLEYLQGKIKPVMGENAPFYTRLVDLKGCAASHVASAIPDSDVLTYSGTSSRNLETGMDDCKLFNRTVTIHVVLGEAKLATLEPLFEQFLASLDRGFVHAGHYIALELGEAGWVDEKDSLINAAIAVEIPIIFAGGIYRTTKFGEINAINIERE